MGDLPPGSAPKSLDGKPGGLSHDEHQYSAHKAPSSNTPFHTQLGTIPQGHGGPDIRSSAHSASPHYPSQDHSASTLNMGSMAGALPEHPAVELGQGNPQAHQQHLQRPLTGASTSAVVYQLQQNLQMPRHGSGNPPAQTAYAPGQYQQNYAAGHVPHPSYGPYHPNQQRLPHPSSLQAQYQGFHQPSQYMYYPSPYGQPSQLPPQSQAMYGRRPSISNTPMPMIGQNMELPQNDGVYPCRFSPGAVPGESGPAAPMLSASYGAPGES